MVSLGESYAETGNLASALKSFEKATDLDPFLETAWRGKMHTFIQMGNRTAALAEYNKLKLVLKKEMDTEPSSEVESLYQKIVKMTL